MNRVARTLSLRPLLVLVGLVVTVLFTYLAVRDVQLAEVWDALRASNYWWLLPALATLALAVFLRAVRWYYLFQPETRPPLGAVVTATLIGYFFNNVLPARAGEAARVVVLKQQAGTSRAETLSTVVLERAYDVLSLLILLFLTLPWLPAVSWLRAAIVLALVLGLALGGVITALALWGDRPLRFVLRPLTRLRFFGGETGERAVQNLLQGLGGVTRARLGVGALLWTTASWLTAGISCWFVMLGFDLGLSPIAGIFVLIAIGLAMILPSSPAAVGVFEAATLVALRAYGVSNSQALSYAVVLHALNFVPFVVVGGLVLHRHAGLLRRRSRAPHAGAVA